MKILSMSGFVPEQICDTIRFSQYHGDRNIAHYCGYASDFISQVLNDNNIDGAVFPKSCDSTRVISSYISKTGKFLFQMPVPKSNNDLDITFLATSIKRYKEAIEIHYDVSIDDIVDRIDMVNERNAKLRDMYAHIGEVSFSEYLQAIHEMLQKPLAEQTVPSALKEAQGGKPIFVVGSFLSNTEIAKKMEHAGLRVIGNTLTESGRLASVPSVKMYEDVYTGIARSISMSRLSPTQNGFKKIMEADIDELKKKGAAGVVFITQKYCEPYDFLYSVYKPALDFIGVPSVKISFNDTEDSRKAELVLEAFSEMI